MSNESQVILWRIVLMMLVSAFVGVGAARCILWMRGF